MKKLVLMLAVAFSVSLFSCGGNAEKECCDSCCADSAAPVEEVVDTTVADTTVADTAAVVAE
ncbi:MAG: hypothetical protein ACI391_06925 [Muribaculaceae bacterium]